MARKMSEAERRRTGGQQAIPNLDVLANTVPIGNAGCRNAIVAAQKGAVLHNDLPRRGKMHPVIVRYPSVIVNRKIVQHQIRTAGKGNPPTRRIADRDPFQTDMPAGIKEDRLGRTLPCTNNRLLDVFPRHRGAVNLIRERIRCKIHKRVTGELNFPISANRDILLVQRIQKRHGLVHFIVMKAARPIVRKIAGSADFRILPDLNGDIAPQGKRSRQEAPA